MGKKSRRKGGGGTKAARKERLQERREQQLEDFVPPDGHPDAGREREFFEGDRVWYSERGLHSQHRPFNRGTVTNVNDDGTLDIGSLRRGVATDEVLPDWSGFTKLTKLGMSNRRLEF